MTFLCKVLASRYLSVHTINFPLGYFHKATRILSLGLVLIYGAIFFREAYARGRYSYFVGYYTAGKILEQDTLEQLYDMRLQYAIQRGIAPNLRIWQEGLPFVHCRTGSSLLLLPRIAGLAKRGLRRSGEHRHAQ
jgi:hypothetical protein